MLARLYRRRVPVKQVYTFELVDTMAQMATQLDRDLAVLINRRGQITTVVVGDAQNLVLPPIKKREAISRLCGLRCVIIHSKGGGLSRHDLVALAKHRLDLIAAIELEDGMRNAQAWLAHLEPDTDEEGNLWRVHEPMPARQLPEKFDFEAWLVDLERRFAETSGALAVETGKEKALIVNVQTSSDTLWDVEDGASEIEQLALTAGAEILGRVVQKRDKPDPALYVGRGKAEEIALTIQELGANVLIVDAELSPSQQANLEQVVGVKVIDRPGLILDIFAQRAHTREGKLQVELAQLNYLLPRLRGFGQVLSRLGGGIGTRGPGETKLEVDRRRIWKRIAALEEDVAQIKQQRSAQRKSRYRQGAVVAALVGYTNAGKSTLLNTMTRAEVLAEDKLFATLDPTTRRLHLPDGTNILLTDTVGFIQRLPHQLVAAFRATLEEVVDADILIHVVDVSHPLAAEQVRTVNEVLTNLEAQDKPTITVLNKVDRLNGEGIPPELRTVPNPVTVSALTREGLPALTDLLQTMTHQILTERYATKE